MHLVRDYGKITKRLQLIPKTLEDAVGVRDWLLSKYSSEVARRRTPEEAIALQWKHILSGCKRNTSRFNKKLKQFFVKVFSFSSYTFKVFLKIAYISRLCLCCGSVEHNAEAKKRTELVGNLS